MIIEKDKGGVVSQLSFSIPNILKIQEVAIKDPALRVLPKYNAQGNRHQWVLPTGTNEKWQQLGMADPLVRQQVLDRISDAKQAFANSQKGADPKQIDAIFNTPDNDQFVYYRTDFDGTLMGVSIAAWGFRYPDNSQRKGVVMKDGGANIQKVQISIIEEGSPWANREFKYGLPSVAKSKLGITDKFGNCAIGNFAVGIEFFVFDVISAKNFTFTVKKGQESYVCDVTVEKVLARLQVLDRDGNPIPNFPVFIYYNGKKDRVLSDDEGFVPMSKMPVNDTFSVTDGESDSNREDYVVVAGKDTYVYQTDAPKPIVPEPPEIPKPEVKEEVLVKLRVVDNAGIPVPNFPVFIEHNGKKLRLSSDNGGFIPMSKMKVGDTFSVSDAQSDSNRVDYMVAADKDTYIYQIDLAKPKEKGEVFVKIQVVDKDGVPVPNFPVFIEHNGKKDRLFSDNGGYIPMSMMTEDDTFAVTDGFSDTNRKDYVVEADRDTYIYDLDYSLRSGNKDITIHVIDEKERPVKKDYIILKLNEKILQSFPDDKGCIFLDNDDFERNRPIKFILVKEGNEFSADDFMLIPGEQEYTVQIDTIPCPWWKRLLEVLAAIAAAVVVLYVFALIALVCDKIA